MAELGRLGREDGKEGAGKEVGYWKVIRGGGGGG